MDPSQQGQVAPTAVVLLIIGEPFSEEQKTLILEQITKGFQCWDEEDTGININKVLAQIASDVSLGDEGAGGERLIQHQSHNLAVEIVVNPLTQTVKNSMKKLLIAPASTKYIIYAGHVFQGSGAWVLQDDTFTFSSLAQVVRNIDVENALKQNPAANLTIHTLADSNWGSSISKADFTSNLRIQFNPPEKLDSVQGVLEFVAYVGGFVKVVPITSLLQASEQFGNISFTRPTLYIFPGCQGDSALFGVSGFNLLVNGGYNRRACFWDFARHLDRVDAMLMTHLGTDNIFGLKSVLQRKCLENIHPQIGYLYFNAPEKQSLPSGDDEGGDSSKKSSLLINLAEEASNVTGMAKQLGISPHPCSRSATAVNCDPVNLYHKLGHGSLDMYFLNPVADSKELKEFYQLWNKQAPNLGTNGPFPLQNTLSVCTLLVWRPYNFDEKIVRILFPGNAPQHKVIEGFEKMKSFGFLKYSFCTTRDLMKPPPVKKAAAGSSKSGTGSKEPARAPKSETGKSLNATKIESPRKESKTFPAKPDVRTLSPTKPTKSVKEESNNKNSKVNDKPKIGEKETKSKPSVKENEKETKVVKCPRPVSVPCQVKGPVSPSKASPNKCNSTTGSLPTQDSPSSIKSPVKTNSPAAAKEEESKSIIAAAPADETESDASAFNHVDQYELKQKCDQQELSRNDEFETLQTLNTISEARDAVGAVDDMSVSMSSAVDRHKLESLGIYDDKHTNDCADRGGKYEIEEDERPQALPEPNIMVESPSLEPDDLHGYNCKVQTDVQELSELGIEKENKLDDDSKTPSDLALNTPQSPEQSPNEHHDYQVTSSLDRQSEFETPFFTNDVPDPHQPSVEQSIQYGIDNSSNGRDMGGIQEVDEEENEDYTSNVTNEFGVLNDNNLDKQALHDMGIYEDDEGIEDSVNGFENDSTPDDNEIKRDHEEEEEIGSDCRTSAERQFEDVDDDNNSQHAQDDDTDERIEDDEHSSLPAAFDKDSSPEDVGHGIVTQEEESTSEHGLTEREDRDSLDGCTPNDEQNIDESDLSPLNGDVDHNAEKVLQTYGNKSAEVATLKPFFDETYSAVRDHTHNKDLVASDDESATSFDPAAQWGHPMGLPSPPPTDRKPPTEGKKGITSPNSAGTAKVPKSGAAVNDTKSDAKKRPMTAPGAGAKGASRPASATKRVTSSSRSSPVNTKISTLPPLTPFYIDLTYIPNHADSSYSDVEFFKRIRARYYVISALSPNPQVLDSLLEAKATWEQKDLEVTIIPTYENDTLRHWMGLNTEKLQELRVDLKPAVSRCTIQLQDLETSLPAYRLEV